MSSSPLRPLREDDADAVAALFVEAWGEARRMDGEEIREWPDNQVPKPENLLVLHRNGGVVGDFDVWLEDHVPDLDAAAPRGWDEALEHPASTAPGLGAARV